MFKITFKEHRKRLWSPYFLIKSGLWKTNRHFSFSFSNIFSNILALSEVSSYDMFRLFTNESIILISVLVYLKLGFIICRPYRLSKSGLKSHRPVKYTKKSLVFSLIIKEFVRPKFHTKSCDTTYVLQK